MDSSAYIMSIVIWNLVLSYATVWMVSSSFCALLSSASVVQGIDYIPLYFLCAACILSKTFLILANSFLMLPLWFSTSSNSSTAQSCTLSAARSKSSSMVVCSRIFLWDLAFLCGPPVCMIGYLGGPISCGVVFDGVPCVVVSPLPYSSYVEALSFFPVCTSFFGALPLFYCVEF
jgi:hypothetical protein